MDELTGCVLRRIGDGEAPKRALETSDEWYGVLRDVFDLPLDDLTAAERERLWARVRAAHDAWLAA